MKESVEIAQKSNWIQRQGGGGQQRKKAYGFTGVIERRQNRPSCACSIQKELTVAAILMQ
jgi:hypothetical protein